MRVDIKKIIDLRQRLHRMAELSMNEIKTSNEIHKFLQKFKFDKEIKIGETGLAFVYDSGKPGETIVFRSELDALPIAEPEDIFNKSLNKGVSHKCGHDGHSAILCGLAEAINYDRPEKGKMVFLFQPAEETLTGARTVLENKDFVNLNPAIFVALHNLPQYEPDSIIVKSGSFTSATNGVEITLTGKPSHAAYPDKAVNPTRATVKVLQFLLKDIYSADYKDFVLSTPVYTQIGNPDYGVTPGNAKIMVTLRAFDYADLDKMIGMVQDNVRIIAKNHNLKYRISYTDDAPPVENNKQLVELVKQTAEENNRKIIEIDKPFRWAEDFGYYTLKYKGVYFGYGMGDIPQLHNEYYNFDDNRLLPAIEFLYKFYKKLQQQL